MFFTSIIPLYRRCRYEKCLQIGMKPELVDSCKNEDYKIIQNNTERASNRKACHKKNKSNSDAKQENNTPQSISEKEEKDMQKVYDEVCEKVCQEMFESHLEKLLAVDLSLWENVEAKKKLAIPKFYVDLYREVCEKIVLDFLQGFLPQISSQTLKKVTKDSTKSLCGLIVGLEHCYRHKSFLEQASLSYPTATPTMMSVWEELYPKVKTMQAIPHEAFANLTSPWAANAEYEELSKSTNQRLEELIEDDNKVSRLFTFLLFFSPTISLSSEEDLELKRLQSKVSMWLYHHMLYKEGSQNTAVLDRLTRLSGIVKDLNKCGNIYTEKMIPHENEDLAGSLKDLNTIELTGL